MERLPSESFDDYKKRLRTERAEFNRHMQGTPLAPVISQGNRLLQIKRKSRQAKKAAMVAMGVTGKRFRVLLKAERRMKKEKQENG
jgi:hypothetical protein